MSGELVEIPCAGIGGGEQIGRRVLHRCLFGLGYGMLEFGLVHFPIKAQGALDFGSFGFCGEFMGFFVVHPIFADQDALDDFVFLDERLGGCGYPGIEIDSRACFVRAGEIGNVVFRVGFCVVLVSVDEFRFGEYAIELFPLLDGDRWSWI